MNLTDISILSYLNDNFFHTILNRTSELVCDIKKSRTALTFVEKRWSLCWHRKKRCHELWYSILKVILPGEIGGRETNMSMDRMQIRIRNVLQFRFFVTFAICGKVNFSSTIPTNTDPFHWFCDICEWESNQRRAVIPIESYEVLWGRRILLSNEILVFIFMWCGNSISRSYQYICACCACDIQCSLLSRPLPNVPFIALWPQKIPNTMDYGYNHHLMCES
jgi:hypothetical protein